MQALIYKTCFLTLYITWYLSCIFAESVIIRTFSYCRSTTTQLFEIALNSFSKRECLFYPSIFTWIFSAISVHFGNLQPFSHEDRIHILPLHENYVQRTLYLDIFKIKAFHYCLLKMASYTCHAKSIATRY